MRPLAFMLMLLLSQPAVQAAREFREYPGLEADAAAPLPDDYRVPGEFVVGRSCFPASGFGRYFGSRDWTQGGTALGRGLSEGRSPVAKMLRRLTTMSVRSVEQR